ncbi:MAG: 2-phosphosulfolactate phosphatase [Firmicutes bacterium]|nr:2-phosphosulfolactate phosphatase [Bacillota bacterium]
MRVDVSLAPGEITAKDAQHSVVVVIDVLRATSTIAIALANGCEEVIPTESIEEAITIARGYQRSDYLLGGERKGEMVNGFDLGNSPLEYTPARVQGKKIILTTTNGTRVIKEYCAARDILIGSFLNADAVVDACIQHGADVVLACAGREGRFGMEDALCAGLLASSLAVRARADLSDSARAAAVLYDRGKPSLTDEFLRSEHGAYLASIGFEEDVRMCADISRLDVVPKVFDRRVIRRSTTSQRSE